MKLYCYLRSIWRTITTQAPWSGHTFVDEEKYEGGTVYVSRCEDCGEVDVTWKA